MNKIIGLLLFFLVSATASAQVGAQAIRKIDFHNFSYSTCFDEGKKTTRITNGKYTRTSKEKDFSYTVYFEIIGITYGDLNGDGQEEAVVETLCNGGGTGQFSDGLIYTLRSVRPVLIGNLGVGDRADGGIHAINIENRLLKVARYGGNSGACCPDYIETYTYKMTGRKLVDVGKPVQSDYVSKDGEYAVRRVRFQRGATATTITSSNKGNETFLIGARAGQTLTLNIKGSNAAIELQAPEGKEIAQPKFNQLFTVRLAASGDYRLSFSTTNGVANFTVEISIK